MRRDVVEGRRRPRWPRRIYAHRCLCCGAEWVTQTMAGDAATCPACRTWRVQTTSMVTTVEADGQE